MNFNHTLYPRFLLFSLPDFLSFFSSLPDLLKKQLLATSPLSPISPEEGRFLTLSLSLSLLSLSLSLYFSFRVSEVSDSDFWFRFPIACFRFPILIFDFRFSISYFDFRFSISYFHFWFRFWYFRVFDVFSWFRFDFHFFIFSCFGGFRFRFRSFFRFSDRVFSWFRFDFRFLIFSCFGGFRFRFRSFFRFSDRVKFFEKSKKLWFSILSFVFCFWSFSCRFSISRRKTDRRLWKQHRWLGVDHKSSPTEVTIEEAVETGMSRLQLEMPCTLRVPIIPRSTVLQTRKQRRDNREVAVTAVNSHGINVITGGKLVVDSSKRTRAFLRKTFSLTFFVPPLSFLTL